MSLNTLKTQKRFIFVLSMLFISYSKAFSFDSSWENVTYVPSLSEVAKKDNDFFEEDSFNEVSYSITRPVEIEEGKVFSRPTFMTQIIFPQITAVMRGILNHTQKRYNNEETPYFYNFNEVDIKHIPEAKEVKINEKISNFTDNKSVSSHKSESLDDKHELVIENTIKNDKIDENDENEKNPLKIKIKMKTKKTKKTQSPKTLKIIDDLSREIKEMNKKTSFLVKSLNELKNENKILKKKIRKKAFYLKKHRVFLSKNKNVIKIQHNKKLGEDSTTFHYPHSKIKKHKKKHNGLFKKMEKLKKIQRFFEY